MLKHGKSRRNLRNICLLATGTSVVAFAAYVKKTADILSNSFDSSILDVYDECDQPISSPYTKWITPRYEDKRGMLHRVGNFVKFLYAKRLAALAQSDDQLLRVRAIKHLTKLQLDEWQYSIIAHMADARMAVGIARSSESFEASQRFFTVKPRHYDTINNQLLLHTIKDYLNLLYKDTGQEHGCLQKTISKIFLQAYDINRIIDSDHGTEALSYVGKETDDVLPLCLETVRHHSAICKFSKHILNHMGLYLLMEVHQRHMDDLNISIPLCQIISNISMHRDLLEEIFKAGWISVLAKWVHHPDIRIAGPASQALANLDQDTIGERYSTNIYLLHPRARSEERVLVDVVFVHGLLGSVFYTWRNGRAAKSLDLVGKRSYYQQQFRRFQYQPLGDDPPLESIGMEDEKIEYCNANGSSNPNKFLAASSDPAIREYLQQMAEHEKLEWDRLGTDYEIVQFDIPEDTNMDAAGPYTISHSEARKCLDTDDRTQCWARDWLPLDCSHLRVLGVNYSTSLSLWAHMCPEVANNVTLEERSTELITELMNAGVGKRPVIWVSHSMGGLLVKNVISKALQSDKEEMKNIAKESRAIFFYSTPHAGSKTAILNQTTSYLVWPSMDVQELREDSPNLHRIHNEFLEYMDHLPIKVFSFVENKPTIVSALKLNIDVVEKKSGNPGVGEVYEIPLNHLGICKPTNRQSFLYQKVLTEVRKVVSNEKESFKVVTPLL